MQIITNAVDLHLIGNDMVVPLNTFMENIGLLPFL